MRTLLTGECRPENIFELVDPTDFVEVAFEAEVVTALTCLLPDYFCGVFAGEFLLDGERRSADLALIHKSLSHWFVVEVELASHSLEHHVIPQVRCFRYGEPVASCVTSLCRGFSGITRPQAESLLAHVPRGVAVVSNVYDHVWHPALRALDVQFLTVSVFRDYQGRTAHEVQGRLAVLRENLGFGQFWAVDNSVRLPKTCGLALGVVRIEDQFGSAGLWTVREEGSNLWLTKNVGPALIQNGSYVQVVRTIEGRICLRPQI
jgi:hypothetical protein